jgi:hypothetical protein
VNTQNLLATFQLRGYLPTASTDAVGMHQFSVEPALLMNFNLLDYLTLEGEGKYWVPLTSNRYNGEVVEYGAGLAYGQRDPGGVWIAPVVEGIGWSVLSGHELVPGPMPTVIRSHGENIFNLYGGFRLGFGDQFSIYAGYGRALTGAYWYKDVWRIEFRFFF